MSVMSITKETYEKEVVQSQELVLIDFWASWCGPCKMLSPIVDEIANEVTGVKVCKVNVDEEPELAEKFRIMSIPTLVVVREGEVLRNSVGLVSKAHILEMLSEV